MKCESSQQGGGHGQVGAAMYNCPLTNGDHGRWKGWPGLLQSCRTSGQQHLAGCDDSKGCQWANSNPSPLKTETIADQVVPRAETWSTTLNTDTQIFDEQQGNVFFFIDRGTVSTQLSRVKLLPIPPKNYIVLLVQVKMNIQSSQSFMQFKTDRPTFG